VSSRRPQLLVAASEEFLDLGDSWPLLREALAREGLQPSVVLWTDPTVDWARADLVLAMFAWGYVAHRREFVAWAYAVEAQTRLVNSAPVLEWGSDKTYLRDLAAEGVPIVPTEWVPPGGQWLSPSNDYVVKPSVASGGMGAARYVDQVVEIPDRHIRRLHADGQTVMIQPYQAIIDAEGETALIFLSGHYSHAIHKRALLRADVGVTERLWEQEVISAGEPRQDQHLLAERVVDAVARLVGPTTYARVDVVDSPEGSPLVLEVEVVEPSLFLIHCPEAARHIASTLRYLCG
jgi:glutathione synthase/RimK-type ligase-like ATP-grasp enzyme